MTKKATGKKKKRRSYEDTSIEGLEARIALDALRLAHKQILAGTASSQVHTHFLKHGSSIHRLEKSKLKGEIKLIDAKVENIKEQKNSAALYAEAITALKNYGSSIVSNSAQEVENED